MTVKGAPSPKKTWDDVVIQEAQVGVYQILISNSKSAFNLPKRYNDALESVPAFKRLIVDVYTIAPALFCCYVVLNMAEGLKSAIVMQLSSSLLRTIEASLLSKTNVADELAKALLARLVWAVLVSLFDKWHTEVDKRMEQVVRNHFNLYLLQAKMRLDIPTSLDPSSAVDVTSGSAWRSFEEIVQYLTSLVSVVSQLLVLYHTATSMNATFVCICLVQPLFSAVNSRSLWDKECYAFVNNEDHIRAQALNSLSNEKYRSDVISSNLAPWILGEWKSSIQKRGNISYEYPFLAHYKDKSRLDLMIASIMNDLPMVFCALAAMLQPGRLSITSIAIFQTSTTTLQWSIHSIMRSSQTFRKAITAIVSLYKASEIQNQVVDGQLDYPLEKGSSSRGMAFELKNLSFTYPGSKKTAPSLTDVSVTIPAGAVVVVVGGNGSGKSTLVKILTRMYDPSSSSTSSSERLEKPKDSQTASTDSLLIDGHPASSYTTSSLRQATALLSQDNILFPLPLHENIGLGYIEHVRDMDMIRDAAVKGGASEIIEKMKDGYNTVLDPKVDSYQMNTWGMDKEHPLKVRIKEVGNPVKVSGGEKQRIVASRTFMKLQSGNVKFIAVDEPTSAMDAEAELHLFNGILDARHGKTVLFVTHRFGHLTKYADLILCMKDGALVEQGTHEDLIKVEDGEYAKLYKIQADAFSNASPSGNVDER